MTKTVCSIRLDNLQPEAPLSLAGLKKLLGHQYALSTELERIKTEVRELAKPKPVERGRTFAADRRGHA